MNRIGCKEAEKEINLDLPLSIADQYIVIPIDEVISLAKKKKTLFKKRKPGPKKTGKAVNENAIAVIMIFLGLFISLSLNTRSMGLLGNMIRFVLQGLLGKLAILFAICVLILGAVKVVYYKKFSFKQIKIGLPVWTFLEANLFYGFISQSSLPKGEYQWSVVSRVFSESAEGLNIGIIPYSITYFFLRFLGRWGLFILITAIFLFISAYYFDIGPSKLLNNLHEYTSNTKGFLSKLKDMVLNFVTEEEEEESSGFEEDNEKEAGIYADMQPFDPKHRPSAKDTVKPSAPVKEDYQLKPLKKGIYDEEERKQEMFRVFFGEDNLRKDTPDHLDDEVSDIAEVYQEENEVAANLNQFVGRDSLSRSSNIDGEQPREKRQQGYQYHKERELVQKRRDEHPTHEGRKDYILPPYWLLDDYKKVNRSEHFTEKNAKLVEETLSIFSVDAKVVNVSMGPTITRYELQPKTGTKVSKILNLTDDLCLALAAESIRIEAPIPGKSLIGIEVSNRVTETVGFKSVVSDQTFRKSDSKVSFVLGKDVTGQTRISDLVKMPHLLIAGSTGSGKSVCINTLICSILFRAKPDEVKFIMIDPKMVELSIYNGIPHLMMPVVTDMKKAPYALSWAVDEMNRRYKLFAENHVKDISGYNSKFPEEKIPSIVIVVDELADLMLVSPREVEDAICRLAQMARACGMHLVIATQRPSVDVITGLIKANIPSRIAFAVSSQTDSRTILDIGGAEKLLGKGDMLYYPIGLSKPLRIQGAFITEKEVSNIVSFINEQSASNLSQNNDAEERIEEMIQQEEEKDEIDPLYDEVVDFAIDQGKVSTSLVQRKFRIGYNRASRIMDAMEEKGVIAPSDGVRPRTVLIEKTKDKEQ